MAHPTPTSLKVPNFEAWVEVDGKRSEVYGLHLEDKKMTGYIECKEGSKFTITYKSVHFPRPVTDFEVTLYVDGDFVESVWYTKTDPEYDMGTRTFQLEDTIEGFHSGKNEITPLLFKPIAQTDDTDRAEKSETYLSNLGTIVLKISRVRYVSGRAAEEWSGFKDRAVDEKKKIGISHQVGVGAPVSYDTEQWPLVITELYDRKEPYFAQLEFRYLSRDLLELKGFIEPPPENSASLQKQLEMLQREVKDLRSQDLKRVKEEESEERKSKRAKSSSTITSSASCSPKRRNKAKLEVIVIEDD